MHLSNELIESFQALHKKHYGKEISRDEALDGGIRLIRFFRAINGLNNLNKKYEQQTENITRKKSDGEIYDK